MSTFILADAVGITLFVGLVLDILLSHQKKAIQDVLHVWWYTLSCLHIQDVITRAVTLSNKLTDDLCGKRILSLHSLLMGFTTLLLLLELRVALLLCLHNGFTFTAFHSVLMLTLPFLIPGMVSYLITRVFIRFAGKKTTILRCIVCLFLDLLLIAIVYNLVHFTWGALLVAFTKIAYDHGIPVTEMVAIALPTLFVMLMFNSLCIFIVLAPTLSNVLLIGFYVLLFLASKLCYFVERLLAEWIENEGTSPFRYISGVLVIIFAGIVGLQHLLTSLSIKAPSTEAIQISLSSGLLTAGGKLAIHAFYPPPTRADQRLKAYLSAFSTGMLAEGEKARQPGTYTNRPTDVANEFGKHLLIIAKDWEKGPIATPVASSPLPISNVSPPVHPASQSPLSNSPASRR